MARRRVTDKWLREHFPTTPGMKLPDYVICNMFADRVLGACRAIPRTHQYTPLSDYAHAYGYLHGLLGQMAAEVPGVIKWMHDHTAPAPWERGYVASPSSEEPAPQSEAKPSASAPTPDDQS